MSHRWVNESDRSCSGPSDKFQDRARRLPIHIPIGWDTSRTRATRSFSSYCLQLIVGGGIKLLQALLRKQRPPPGSTIRIPAKNRSSRPRNWAASGVTELFRLLSSAPTAPLRDTAGHALAILWKADQLVAEEEKAIVTYAGSRCRGKRENDIPGR